MIALLSSHWKYLSMIIACLLVTCSHVQAVFIVFSENVTLRTVFYTLMTFGLGHICIKEQITPLQARAAIMAQPLFMFLFMFLVWLAIRRSICVKYLQHLQKRNSLAHVVWLNVIYSTAALAFTATSLLNSVTLEGIHGTRHVLFHDGSVESFGREHLPYAMLAIFVMLIFVVPAPLVMAVPRLRSIRQLKWYTDEAMRLYEPGRQWWAAVDLARRLLLACMQGSINAMQIRRYAVALTCIVLLATHVAFWYVTPE